MCTTINCEFQSKGRECNETITTINVRQLGYKYIILNLKPKLLSCFIKIDIPALPFR